MKAAVYYGPNDIKIENIEDPICPNGGLLVKVEACGICGSDIRTYKVGSSTISPPQVLGHEFCGVIIESKCEDFKEGSKVVVAPDSYCHKCDSCLKGFNNLCVNMKSIGINTNGGFAEYVSVSPEHIFSGAVYHVGKLPETGACLAEPLACCINGQEAANVSLGDRVLIIGAGPIGLMHLELAKRSGAVQVMVSEVSEKRSELARELGADLVINPQKDDLEVMTEKLTKSNGFDVVIVANSLPMCQETALRYSAAGGRILFFGGLAKGTTVSLDTNLLHYGQRSILGCSAFKPYHFRKAIALLECGHISWGKYVDAEFDLDNIKDAFGLASSGRSLKVVVRP